MPTVDVPMLAAEPRVSETTIKRWARIKRIPTIRPSRRTIRFDLEAVLEALTQRPADNREEVGDAK
jgi:excisionase family DNA binding protein